MEVMLHVKYIIILPLYFNYNIINRQTFYANTAVFNIKILTKGSDQHIRASHNHVISTN
jgi:hypothetical protein